MINFKDYIEEKFLQDLLTPNEFKRELEQEIEDAGYSPKVIKKITKKGNYYYENHLSLLKLNKITKKFIKHDFTLEVIKYPKRYEADDMLEQDSFKHKIIVLLSKIFYFFIPTYIWVLEKP